MTDKTSKWLKTTVKKAKQYVDMGCLIWWRPNGVQYKDAPDMDEAWILIN